MIMKENKSCTILLSGILNSIVYAVIKCDKKCHDMIRHDAIRNDKARQSSTYHGVT